MPNMHSQTFNTVLYGEDFFQHVCRWCMHATYAQHALSEHACTPGQQLPTAISGFTGAEEQGAPKLNFSQKAPPSSSKYSAWSSFPSCNSRTPSRIMRSHAASTAASSASLCCPPLPTLCPLPDPPSPDQKRTFFFSINW